MNDSVTQPTSIEALQDFLQSMAQLPGELPGLSELDHGLQCAAELKASAPHDIELQIAGLVHDISHGRCHIRDHGDVGGAVVRQLLGDRVATLVRLHVAAKRYLITCDASYLSRLSPVSIRTFELQGGLMTAGELERFAADPCRDAAILLRNADDAAKSPGRVVPGLHSWHDALRHVAARS